MNRNLKITITLSQDSAGETYTVQRLTGSAQFLIGDSVERERVQKWCSDPGYSHVIVRIVGVTNETGGAQEQLDLIPDENKKTRKPIAMAK